MNISFINMIKYRKQGSADRLSDPLLRWLIWLDAESPPELVAEVVNMDKAIQKADERMVYVTGDKDAIRAYERRMMGLSDYNSGLNFARREGKAEGITEGIAVGVNQANLEIARKMKALGDSTEKIQAITGLSAETIETL